MSITITITADTAEELRAKAASVLGTGMAYVPASAQVAGDMTPGEVIPTADADTPDELQGKLATPILEPEKKPKRTRKTKAKAPAKKAAEPEKGNGADTDETESVVTHKMVRMALAAKLDTHHDQLVDILKNVGATDVSSIKDEDLASVYENVQAL